VRILVSSTGIRLEASLGATYRGTEVKEGMEAGKAWMNRRVGAAKSPRDDRIRRARRGAYLLARRPVNREASPSIDFSRRNTMFRVERHDQNEFGRLFPRTTDVVHCSGA
jgi:hypothetical protein